MVVFRRGFLSALFFARREVGNTYRTYDSRAMQEQLPRGVSIRAGMPDNSKDGIGRVESATEAENNA